MSKDVKFIDVEPVKDLNIIKKVEELFKIKFPNDYLKYLEQCNGAYINPNCFKTDKNKEESINNFFSFNENDKYSYILETYNAMSKYIPEKIYPFAQDAADNLICFDYRTDNNPSIVFLDYETAYIDKEKAISKIADTFTDFIESLYEGEEE